MSIIYTGTLASGVVYDRDGNEFAFVRGEPIRVPKALGEALTTQPESGWAPSEPTE